MRLSPRPDCRRLYSKQRKTFCQNGLSLLEVMIALAIAAAALVAVMSATAKNIRETAWAQTASAAAELARGQMYEIEEKLLHDGFQQTDQDIDGDFSEDGWPEIAWKALIEKAEFPPSGELANAATQLGGIADQATDTGVPDIEHHTQDSVDAASGLMATYLTMLEGVLQAGIRKVTLTVSWDMYGEKDTFDTVLYVFHSVNMDDALRGVGL